MDIRNTIINSIGDLINKDNTNIIYIEKINNYHNYPLDTNEPVNQPVNEPVNEPVNQPVNQPVNEPVNGSFIPNRNNSSSNRLNINASYLPPLPPPPLPPISSSIYRHNYTRRPLFTSISNINIPYYRPYSSSTIYQEDIREGKEEDTKEEDTKENSDDSDDSYMSEFTEILNDNRRSAFQETNTQNNNSNTNQYTAREPISTLNNLGDMIDSILGTIPNMSGELSIEFPVSNILNTSQMLSRPIFNSIESINNQSYLVVVNDTNKASYIHEECSICNVNYREGDIIRKFDKCPHYFHYKCIDRWLNTNKNCPVCTVHII